MHGATRQAAPPPRKAKPRDAVQLDWMNLEHVFSFFCILLEFAGLKRYYGTLRCGMSPVKPSKVILDVHSIFVTFY
jgi:hypothetical protein